MKSEPEVFSIADLKRKKTSLWDGVRNYQARNFMTQQMQVGDKVLFYHSSCEPAGVAGLAKVSKVALPDPSQFDKKSEYYEPRATKDKPVWFCVEVEYVSTFPEIVTLAELRAEKSLKDMLVLKRGQRLSIQPVQPDEYERVIKMAKKK
jgi:predicted RNA-binding protein with PUA-like domain